MAGNITLKISADVQQAINGIGNVNQKLDQLSQKTDILDNKFVKLSTGFNIVTDTVGKVFGAFRKVVEVASELTAAYSVQEQAEVKLQSTLKATQNACGMTATELLNIADSLSSVTTFSDQAILSVEQLLVSARTIGKDVIPEATEACLDMAAALGEDTVSSARRLAKVLADPKSNLDALKDANIQLTQSQKDQITSLQEQNRLYEAQQIVLEAVSSSYGGIAQALADTDTGKIDQLKNAWNDLKEALGEMMMNSLDGLVDYTLSLVQKIEGLVDEHNENTRLNNLAQSVSAGEQQVDYRTLSTEELNAIWLGSRYGSWYEEAKRQIPDFETNRAYYEYKGIEAGVLTEEDVRAAQAVQNEFNRREEERMKAIRLSAYQNLWAMQDVTRNDFGFNTNFIQPSISDQLNKPFGIDYDSIFMSAAEPYANQMRAQDAFSEYIKSNGSLSSTYQIEAINQRMLEGYRLIASGGLSDDQVKQITEINEALHEQKKAFSEAAEGSEDWKESFADGMSIASDIISQLTSINDSISDIFSSMADGAIDSLDEIQEKWDEYFTELDEKQERQRDSLNALLASGNISYQDYIDSMNALDEERSAAESEAEKEKEEQRKKADELNKAAFIANQANAIANATIAGAQSIMNVWADATTPVWAKGVMTGLVSATTAAQIAAISCQQYTPLAVGGIVQSPTRALIGEGGHPEMVLPLTDSNMERFGMNGDGSEGGIIQLTINIGTAYNGEQLAEDVFKGIERAQRTGALPKWRFTA